MTDKLFTLEPGRWYALTMYPGYSNEPYRSPIEVQALRLLGDRMFELTFWNVGYAQGVQDFTKQYRTLRRHAGSLVAQECEQKERIIVFEPLTGQWIGAYVPRFSEMLAQAIERKQVFSVYHKS